jgi:hypothetical protein
MSEARILDHEESLDARVAAAFAKPVESGQLVPLPSTNVAISDAIITAQKVAVERDEAKVLAKIKIMAQAAGDEWFYRYPVKNNRTGQTDWIEGPSIKCANNVARYYGNCQVDTRVVDNGDSWIVYARFVDYETGFSYTRPFQQRKGQQSIKSKDTDRQLDIALQIGVSKAIRNVVCNALETFTNFAFDEAKNAIVGKVGQKLDQYRERVVSRLGEMRVDISRVDAAIGRPSKDWLAPDVARIIAQLQAINDGMATIEETWPTLQTDQVQTESKQSNLDRFEEKHAGKAETVTPFEIADLAGELHQKTDATEAGNRFVLALDEAEKQQGEKGLTAVWENNAALMTQLEERGFSDMSRQISEIYGKRREAAAQREAQPVERNDEGATQSPTKAEGFTAAQQNRDPEWWDRERLTIEAPDRRAFEAEMHRRLREARRVEDVGALRDDNGEIIDQLPKATKTDVLNALMNREKELRQHG